jgi:hypothetical protein
MGSIESADNCVVPNQSGSNTLLATIATAPAIIDVIGREVIAPLR